MNQDQLDHWSGSYTEPYGSREGDDPYIGAGDVKFGMNCSPLTTDSAGVMSFVHPVHNFLQEVPFNDMSHAQNVEYLPPDIMPTSQRQQANQPLYINTQLSSNQFSDPENSTASSSSFHHILQTPYFQVYPNFQPSVYISRGSASAEMLTPDLVNMNMSPLPPSPLSQYSLNLEEGEMPDSPPSPLAIEPDVMTQSPMPHIIEWKRVIGLCRTKDFVPQMVYQPYTEADKKRYIRDIRLQDTIFFSLDESSELGISLDDALKQRLKCLKDKDDLMFVGCGPSVSIRIQWPGYPAWSKQIPTMDFRTPKGPITRAKLAKNIATCVQRFAESMQDKPMEADSDRRWKIGQRHIRVEDLILVSLHHVSKGSWQPQLRFCRPSTAFPFRGDEFLSSVSAS